MMSVFRIYKENEQADIPASLLDEKEVPRWYAIWGAIRCVKNRDWEEIELQSTEEEREASLEQRSSISVSMEPVDDSDVLMPLASERPSATLDDHDTLPAAKRISVISTLLRKVRRESDENESLVTRDRCHLDEMQQQFESMERHVTELESTIADLRSQLTNLELRLTEDARARDQLQEERRVHEEGLTKRLKKKERLDACKKDLARLDTTKKNNAEVFRDLGIVSWREDAAASVSGPMKKLLQKYPDIFPDAHA